MNTMTKAILGYTDHNIDSATWGKFISIFPIPVSTQEEREAARPFVAALGLECAPISKLDDNGDWTETGDVLYA